MNFSASVNAFRLITNPTLCLPQATIPNFNHLPVPVSKAFPRTEKGQSPDIRAVVLDKDNCFARRKQNVVHEEYEAKFQALRAAYPSSLLIVSNTAGSSSDPTSASASLLSANTGVPVLKHSIKKPGCVPEIMAYFAAHPESGVSHPSQVAVVGDRLTTDVLMANMGGMWGVWVKDGVEELGGFEGMFSRMEKTVAAFLLRRGYQAPTPRSPFED